VLHSDYGEQYRPRQGPLAAARVAMIGAGQLARMTHQAAIDLDIELVVLAGSADEPAVLAGAPYLLGPYSDLGALTAAAEAAGGPGVLGAPGVVTFDHELVPRRLLRQLEEQGYALRPGSGARRQLSERGYPVPAFAEIQSRRDIVAFGAAHGWPLVLKARSGGYDGRGVFVVDGPGDVPDGLDSGTADEPGWLVEEHIDLQAELAVLVGRRPSGDSVVYPVVATTQIDGICHWLVTPAEVEPELAGHAQRLARALADDIGAVGICAVEFFVGPGGRLVINELALRPHNSGHASIEANVTSQFHQHLRAVLDWPLGATDLVAPAAAMVNLIAPDANLMISRNLPQALEVEGVHVHLYGKSPRPGRKIGHVTALGRHGEAALGAATAAADLLLGR
jgi:5-(carboxyamino)imidazole ribonucleotide synthase